MPARGRRSAKAFTRRRSAAAFRLRPPVPRMNLSPNRGREDGAAVRPGPPGVVRLRPLLAGRQVLPGYGYGCPFRRSVAHPAFRSPFRRHGLPTPFRRRPFIDVLLSTSFYRRPFIGGLLPKAFFGGPSRRHGLPTPFCRRSFSAARPFGAAPLFFVPDGTVRSAPPSRLCPLSALSPLRSVPSPLRLLSAPSRSCPRPLFWRGAASSLFFGPRVEKPEKLFRFVISK